MLDRVCFGLRLLLRGEYPSITVLVYSRGGAGVFYFTITVSSYHIPKVVARSNVSDNLIDNVRAVFFTLTFVSLAIQTQLLLDVVLILFGWFIIAMTP